MDWIRDHLWETWLIVAGILGVAELLSLDLIFAMLAGGALVGAVTAAATGSLALSVVLALVSAVAMLGFLRPSVMRKIHSAPALRTGHHTLLGMEGVVLEEIPSAGAGRIKVDGQDWLARAYDDQPLAPGRRVEIIEIKGATAYVLPIHELGTSTTDQG